MPASKRQKTGKEASKITSNGDDTTSSTPHKNDEKSKHRDVTTIPDLEYICMPRPHFDCEKEFREDDLEGDEIYEKYAEFKKAEDSGIHNQPAAEHKDWNWIIMWNGFTTYMDYRRRANYCDPDRFGMYIYNDWSGWGLMELIENLMLSFDSERKKKGDQALQQMWSILSATALWLNESELFAFMGNEDGEKVQRITGLMGYALLTALADIDRADELKPDSKFLDLPLVISMFLHFANGLEDYGIEGFDAISWRSHAVAYFNKAGLDPKKGVFGTEKLLDKLGDDEDEDDDDDDDEVKELPKKTAKDPWGWTKRLKDYTKLYGTPKIGGTRYDITKMTRKERAGYAFDKKDPLKDISDKDLKEGNLDFA